VRGGGELLLGAQHRDERPRSIRSSCLHVMDSTRMTFMTLMDVTDPRISPQNAF
jgi:hypothetical protein